MAEHTKASRTGTGHYPQHVAPAVSGIQQLRLDFEPSIRQRFATLRECVYHVALSDPRGMKAVAFDCDKSLSELSRCLNPSDGDPRSCDVNLMVAVMHSTGNTAPLQWLLGEFGQDREARQDAAYAQIQNMLETLPVLLSQIAKSGGRAK